MGTEGDRVIAFARDRFGRQVGDGECWTLAERALESAGAQTSTDIHGSELSRTVDYVWGDPIAVGEARPGDIIQFLAGYSYRKDTVLADGSTRWEEVPAVRQHHTAIVDSIEGGRSILVLHQNWNRSRKVTRSEFYFRSGTFTDTSGNRVTITVNGSANFYRPRRRPAT